jgi:hypothetical protein
LPRTPPGAAGGSQLQRFPSLPRQVANPRRLSARRLALILATAPGATPGGEQFPWVFLEELSRQRQDIREENKAARLENSLVLEKLAQEFTSLRQDTREENKKLAQEFTTLRQDTREENREARQENKLALAKLAQEVASLRQDIKEDVEGIRIELADIKLDVGGIKGGTAAIVAAVAILGGVGKLFHFF